MSGRKVLLLIRSLDIGGAERQLVLLAGRRLEVRFVCVGNGPADYRAKLVERGLALGLAGRIIWAGARHDMSAVYSAFDIVSSSSYGEGSSNAAAEAMSCARPCVVTAVGDSATIVGKTGRVVPARDPVALAEAWSDMTGIGEEGRLALGRAARARVVTEVGTERMVERTGQVLGLW